MTAGGEKSFFDGDKQLETITWQLDEIHGKNNYDPIFVFILAWCLLDHQDKVKILLYLNFKRTFSFIN